MARIVKRKKTVRHFSFLNFSVTLLFVSAVLYMFSALFIRQYNNRLSTEKQEISQQITALELQNDAVEVEIAQLGSADRVDEIAASNGLTKNQDNIITISDTSIADGD